MFSLHVRRSSSQNIRSGTQALRRAYPIAPLSFLLLLRYLLIHVLVSFPPLNHIDQSTTTKKKHRVITPTPRAFFYPFSQDRCFNFISQAIPTPETTKDITLTVWHKIIIFEFTHPLWAQLVELSCLHPRLHLRMVAMSLFPSILVAR